MTNVLDLVSEFVAVLNEKEIARRSEESAAKIAKGERPLSYGYSDDQYCFFSFKIGKKYVKIVQDTGGQYGGTVHAFVDLATGDVLKAAGVATPAKGVRYRLSDEASKADLYARAEFSGGYLYAR